jgi:hypothetical protein
VNGDRDRENVGTDAEDHVINGTNLLVAKALRKTPCVVRHHAIPMQVHITRSVYELISGDMFVVKEKGTVDVKGVQVITYLVTRKNPLARVTHRAFTF